MSARPQEPHPDRKNLDVHRSGETDRQNIPIVHDLMRSFANMVSPAGAAIAAVVLIIICLVIVPLAFLAINTFWGPDGPTLSALSRAYIEDPYIGTMLENSLLFSLGAAALAIGVGTALAFIQVRTDIPLKGLMYMASIVPLILPAVLYAFAWLLLADPNIGLINAVLGAVGLGPVNVLSLPGMMWVEGIHLSSIAFLLMVAAFQSMDPSLDESALMSGATRSLIFRRVSLPLLRPALVSVGLLIFVMALESFETPSVLGLQSGIYVLTTRIYDALNKYPVDYGVPGSYALGLLTIAVIGIGISSRSSRNAKRFQTITGKAFRPRPLDLGSWRRVIVVAVAIYFFVSVVLPIGVLAYASLLPYYRSPSFASLKMLSWANYVTVFNLPTAINAFKDSFILGVSSATLVMALMVVAGWVVARTQARGRGILDLLAFSPLLIPGIVQGVALSYVYLRMPLPIYGTLWILLIAYTTKYLPYGMRYASAAMVQASSELEESAIVCGASWSRTLRSILLPLASNGLLAGWLYILIVSFRELSTAILLYSPGNEVVSVLIWDQFNNGHFTVVAAVGILLIVLLTGLVSIARRFGGAFGV